MSEKCVHEWYYRIVDICSWQFFCIRCGEKLSMDKFSDHASDLEKRMAELEAWINKFIAEGEYLSLLNGIVPGDSNFDKLVEGYFEERER